MLIGGYEIKLTDKQEGGAHSMREKRGDTAPQTWNTLGADLSSLFLVLKRKYEADMRTR